MGRQLDQIIVKGFKSIADIDLQLPNLNILVGANGSGKSNFIGVFRFLNQIMERNLPTHTATAGGADSFLHFGRKTTPELHIELSFAEGTNGYECTLVPTAKDSFVFQEETCWFHDKSCYPTPYKIGLGGGHDETRLLEAAKDGQPVAGYVQSDLRSWRIYHFHDTSDNAKIKQTGDIEDNRFLRPNASNLAAFLYRLKSTSRADYDNIVGTVQLVAPFFDDFILEPSQLNEQKIQLQWKEVGSDTYFNASSLSDGTLRFMCMATLMLQPLLPSTVLLDEPELGLHPYAVNVLSDLLRSASQRTQVIVATQSVTLVNQFEPKDVIVVDRHDGASVFRHLDRESMKDWLEDYGLGDLWEKNIFGGRP